MMSTMVSGAMLPHASQFFTMPDTEDKATVEQVRKVAATIGEKLKALKPEFMGHASEQGPIHKVEDQRAMIARSRRQPEVNQDSPAGGMTYVAD